MLAASYPAFELPDALLKDGAVSVRESPPGRFKSVISLFGGFEILDTGRMVSDARFDRLNVTTRSHVTANDKDSTKGKASAAPQLIDEFLDACHCSYVAYSG